MTRKDYRLIAQAIKDANADTDAKVAIAYTLSKAMMEDSDKFDHIRFYRACGADVALAFGLV